MGLLLPSMVKRLANPEQFQGALYETAVAGAFARAGFEIVLEDESKGIEKKCEFVATHKATGRHYSVEAKSRHRPGILGHGGIPNAKGEEPRVERLIEKALEKVAEHDRIICIDINHPETGVSPGVEWGKVVQKQVDSLQDRGAGPAVLVFTNAPFHYLPQGEPARGEISMTMGLNEPRFQPQDFLSTDRGFPGLVAAMAHFRTPVPGNWD